MTSSNAAATPISSAPPALTETAARPPPLAPAPSNVRTHDDALSFILDTYDSLISPHITHLPNSNASLIAIRRNIFRKQFNAEAFRLIHANKSLTPSVDYLVRIMHLACTSCGLILMYCTFLASHMHLLASPSPII